MTEEPGAEAAQASDADGDPDESRLEDLLRLFLGTVLEARERIDHLEVILCKQLFPTFQSELAKSRRALKRLENEREQAITAWDGERLSLLQELALLRSELQLARASGAAKPDPEDDETMEEEQMHTPADSRRSENRSVLAVLDPQVPRVCKVEAVRAGGKAQSPNLFKDEKENVSVDHKSKEDERIQRLRQENEQLRQTLRTTQKEKRGLKVQYNSLQQQLWGGKAHISGHGGACASQGFLNISLLNSLEMPPKILKRKYNADNLKTDERGSPCGGDELDNTPPGPNASNMKCSKNPLMDELDCVPAALVGNCQGRQAEAMAEQVTFEAPTAIARSAKEKNNEEVLLKQEQILKQAAHKPEREGGPMSTSGNCGKPLEPTGKQRLQLPAKAPAYKYVEPVRKKNDREALQGTECKQCKKFYDAVLMGDANGLVESRCKHHDVSRHRYRNLPPATPEGFWNIGFDSDV